MGGRNYGICHSCRAKDHFFAECPRKRRCPTCKHEFEKCYVVEKETRNKGRLFLCCSENCGFWEWVVNEESSGHSSNSPTTNEIVEDMSNRFESRVRLNDEEELHVSMTVMLRKVK